MTMSGGAGAAAKNRMLKLRPRMWCDEFVSSKRGVVT